MTDNIAKPLLREAGFTKGSTCRTPRLRACLFVSVACVALFSWRGARSGGWKDLRWREARSGGWKEPATALARLRSRHAQPGTLRFESLTHTRARVTAQPPRQQFLQRTPPRVDSVVTAAGARISSSAAAIESESTTLFPQQLNVLYDSKCSVCDVEINLLKQQDKGNQLRVTDIEDPTYDKNDPKNGYVSYEEGMKVIHAVLPNGDILKGYAVFPAMYKAIGLGWVWPSAESPVLGPVINTIAKYWFKYRTVMTRGKTLESIFEERQKCETCGPLEGKATPAADTSA